MLFVVGFYHFLFTFLITISVVHRSNILAAVFCDQRKSQVEKENNDKAGTKAMTAFVSHLITKPTKWHVRPAKTQSDQSLRCELNG